VTVGAEAAAGGPHLTYGRVLAMAWPITASQAATPLLGLVDTWAIGNSDAPLEIGAIALGAVVFAFVYWSFGFLRMGVAGLTAQALGRDDPAEARATLARGAALGFSLGLIIVALQAPIAWTAFGLLQGSADLEFGARTYVAIRIWGAPFALATFALLGWFIGQGRTGLALAVSLWQNGINITLDVWFVLGLNWGVAGVAAGTLIAEASAAAFAGALAAGVLARSGGLRAHWTRRVLLDAAAIRRTLFVNRDIFIRTLCLVLAFAWFTNQGAVYGDVTLAANQVLLQFMLFAGFALDGPAMVAESLVGRAVGARARGAFDEAVRKTSIAALAAAAGFTAAYLLIGESIVALLTAAPEIRAEAARFLPWAAFSPLLLVWPFQLDGIFIGAVRATTMRNAMLVSLAVYIAAWAVFAPMGNHGLWFAFAVFFAARAATLGLALPTLGASLERGSGAEVSAPG